MTTRPIIFKEKTENWIKKHIDFPVKIIHSGDFYLDNKARKKADICKEIGIKIMIEDVAKYALECAEVGILVILFDKPWNKGIKHKNIIRVNNWIEALKEINSFAE